jgi:hypothetical protein
MRYIALALALIATPAFAQQAAPPVPGPTFELKLSAQEINVVQQGLLQLRGADMINTYANIANQVAAQTPPKQDAPTEPAK